MNITSKYMSNGYKVLPLRASPIRERGLVQKAWKGGDTYGKQHDGSWGNAALRDLGHQGQPCTGEVDELSREGDVSNSKMVL